MQILVNKADRLSGGDLERVMTTVAESLAETGLSSWSPPLALSARLALKGKLGDEASLAESRWADVQRLLDEELVGRSDELKERGLELEVRDKHARLVWQYVIDPEEQRTLRRAIPFGPFLALGALEFLFFGDAILQRYLRLFE